MAVVEDMAAEDSMVVVVADTAVEDSVDTVVADMVDTVVDMLEAMREEVTQADHMQAQAEVLTLADHMQVEVLMPVAQLQDEQQQLVQLQLAVQLLDQPQ